jgi:putative restriction endonuclease
LASLSDEEVVAIGILVQVAFGRRNRSRRKSADCTRRPDSKNPSSSTEAVREVVQRVGQDIFRRTLIEYWRGRCAVTGLDVVELLRASHIKPWADCESDSERLDVFNALLLAPHLDALFDKGLVTFSDEGQLLCSSLLSDRQWTLLEINRMAVRAKALADGHRAYLRWHRSKVFRGQDTHGTEEQ